MGEGREPVFVVGQDVAFEVQVGPVEVLNEGELAAGVSAVLLVGFGSPLDERNWVVERDEWVDDAGVGGELWGLEVDFVDTDLASQGGEACF